ncbi:MAG TPA: efflux RND transporter periplasmic adaptor subunit [Chitinophagaceae bacterium]|nr:efflux RND transporter periplasmic adaptor subunit [Chitinophagaceae bacterium]
MKKNTVFIILLLLTLGGLAAWYFGFRKEEKPVILELASPVYGYISNSVTATGKIQPVDTVTIGSQVSGTIKEIYVDFNDRVRKGELIAVLDKSLYLSQENQYIANLELARSNLNFQQSNFNRQKKLFDSSVISRSEYEDAKNQFESAGASVKVVQAQLDGAQKNLSYTNIYSPVDGVVLSRNISIGQTVAASFNTPTLFVIARDITKMQVQAAVDEADIGNVKKGQWAVFTVDAFPDDSFSGQVREIRLQPAYSANVVTYTTIIDAPNKEMKLKPGMTANIFIYTRADSNALLIPSRALRFQPDSTVARHFKILANNNQEPVSRETSPPISPANSPGTKNQTASNSDRLFQAGRVWVKSGDQLIEKIVRTGITDDIHVQILDGLQDSDQVVLGTVQQGTIITATPAPRSPFMPARRRTTTPKPGSTGANR